MAHRRSYIIRSHEDSTQHQTTGQQLHHRRYIDFRINPVHDAGENEYRSQNGYGNVPCNNLLPQHIGQSQQQGQCADFTQTTAVITDQQVERRGKVAQRHARSTADYTFHYSQRCSSRSGIRVSGQLSYGRPCGHLHRERQQQEHTSRQCRVKRITTQTSERHLAYTDSKQGA